MPEREEGEMVGKMPSPEEEYWQTLLAQGEPPPAASAPPEEREEEKGEAGEVSPEGKGGVGPWQRLEECLASGEVLRCKVTGYNRGGLLVELESLEGFVPASLILGMPRGLNDDERKAQFASYVDGELELKVVELNRATSRVVLSERAAVPARERVAKILDRIKEGEIRRGRVTGICDFGAFVNLGGVDGLIHVSELSWGRVGHASEALQVGEWVDVRVLSVDRQRQRVALSVKKLKADPWSLVGEKYQVGQLVRGVITDVVDFGAFAALEEGLEGLIHVSELAEGEVPHPRQLVQQGQEVTLRILRIDTQNRRMALSLKQV